MKTLATALLWVLALPLLVVAALAMLCAVPRDEWQKLNDSLAP